ncbi:map microtubule affinity-regulating kinase 4 isoform 2 [Moniliophthora roreri MCA 2997]|uniref:Map microtubule affinity-regulating kinase 4 isoform 2 n=2 Tax=Moniliophthora roreri TaxID=221103 RepID=V2XRT4_MONRO|nr:map microtubule affinity-regulating kinase 4 isoform 2 [Moniliophthora roreri MCA 2997]KAI3616315.1 map microtubule affinity-regulating kinase 4 isoform 2 [Moniliophthora roreri]
MDHGSSRERSSDVFSFADDEELTHRLRFIKEVGFGNWGSVWQCEPRSFDMLEAGDSFDKSLRRSFAVKLVHRRGEKPEEIKTSAARVKSLWNEMRIIRQLKADPHPSIIPFYSFLLTPSYALITMAYHPDLITVQVAEPYARSWFRFLLSAVDYLHKRGVVHNDIKPANILMSAKGVPILCDFGFAESYDLDSTSAFHSRCSYGTPEYLSPERARGIPHDTRKSDVWSLGITFFEILIGRTPFEESDKEECLTQQDLERYWSRTLRGKWVGSWKMSKGVEKLLRRMLAPNADLRCTASEAMKDPYWTSDDQSSHRRSSSYTSSIVFEKDMSKLMDVSSPWSSPGDRTGIHSPSSLVTPNSNEVTGRNKTVVKSKSQPKVSAIKAATKKRIPVAVDLSPIKASPPTSPNGRVANTVSLHSDSNVRKRQPLGAVNGATRENVPVSRMAGRPSVDELAQKHKGRMLSDLAGPPKKRNGKENHVNQRVRDWERERERLREMSRLEELEKDTENERAPSEQEPVDLGEEEAPQVTNREDDKENNHEKPLHPNISKFSLPHIPTSPIRLPSVLISSSNAEQSTSPVIERRRSGLLTHRIRASIDKTLSTLGQIGGRNPTYRQSSANIQDDLETRFSRSERPSWEDDALVREAKSSLPGVRQAIHSEHVGADNQVDRLTLWMRNVEQVVEDARNQFANGQAATLPPLPLPPASRSASRSNRSSRLPRRILAANEIFSDQSTSTADQSTADQSMTTYVTSVCPSPSATEAPKPVEQVRGTLPEPQATPSRQRRATVSTLSPERITTDPFELNSSPRKEKSRSHGNLLQRHIAPPSELEAALNQETAPLPSPRLSAAVDRNIFIAPPVRSREDVDHLDTPPPISKSFDELTSSPLVVEPYPLRNSSAANRSIPDSPTQRRMEGVYDRFLMATSGVKRVGKGYQSDNNGPMHSSVTRPTNAPSKHRVFYSTRKPMPPPVSSDDHRVVCVDELGVMSSTPCPEAGSDVLRDQSNNTVAMMRRAIKAMVPGKTMNRRLSRLS